MHGRYASGGGCGGNETEGFEVLVSRPTVIKKMIDGRSHEPFETLYLEVPDDAVGGCMQSSNRKGQVENMSPNKEELQLKRLYQPVGLLVLNLNLILQVGRVLCPICSKNIVRIQGISGPV